METLVVDDLIQEVRDQTNESNTATIDDASILRSMNRGQRFITSKLVRSYPQPLLAPQTTLLSSTYDFTNGVNNGMPLPVDIYEDRVLRVYIATPTRPTMIEQRTYSQVNAFNYSQAVPIPDAWYVRGRQIVMCPPLQTTYNVLVDYIRQPDKLVKKLGRVTEWDPNGTWLSVDELDTSSVTTTTDDLASFVNVISGLTGLVKCTLQLASFSATKLTFRASPTYTTVNGRPVSTSFVSLNGTSNAITGDDYICLSTGTCVPQFGNALVGYLVEYASAAIERSLGEATAQIAKEIVDAAAKQASEQLAGRSSTARVKNKSKVWSRAYTRLPFTKS